MLIDARATAPARRAERVRPGDCLCGENIAAEDVSTVLGLVRRDMLFDLADAVAREDGAAAFALAGQAVESGYDLRLVVRELARLTRDILVVNVDPSRVTDPEFAAEAERDRFKALADTVSAKDLMSAFGGDKAEFDIRGSSIRAIPRDGPPARSPRRLCPSGNVMQSAGKGRPGPGAARQHVVATRSAPPLPLAAPAEAPRRPATPPRPPAAAAATVKAVEARTEAKTAGAPSNGDTIPNVKPVSAAVLKDAFLDEMRKSKKFFYGAVVSQAQRIDIVGDRVVFTFAPQHRALRVQLDQNRTWLDALASQLSGRRMTVASAEGSAPPARPALRPRLGECREDRQSDLRQAGAG